MKTRIRQEVAFAETRVAGMYKYRDLFQLRPINPEAPTLEWVMGHHPFLLEYSYDLPDVSETSYNPSIPDHALLPMIDQEASGKAKKWILLAATGKEVYRGAGEQKTGYPGSRRIEVD